MYRIILGKIHDEVTETMLEETLKAAKISYQKVEKLSKEEAHKILGIDSEKQKFDEKCKEIHLALSTPSPQMSSLSEKPQKKKKSKAL